MPAIDFFSAAFLRVLVFGMMARVVVPPVAAAAGAATPLTNVWARGPARDAGFFPIAVWLQSPANAERYRQAGINTYVGLWRGPTDSQLDTLAKAGMKVICAQNEVGLRRIADPTIIGWMHDDEPDNAQSLPDGKGYGPPILPEKVVADYKAMRGRDPSRPVLLNLGQGVAYDDYIGRGVRRGKLEDYPRYLEGCDIASFDIYPVVHDRPEIAGQLGYVARGVERLVRWTDGRKSVWNCIECTRISHPTAKATPRQVRAEVWMSIIHGSTGIIYFVHEWKPRFREAALLEDPEMLEAITRLNTQVRNLAPVIRAPSSARRLVVESGNPDIPIATALREHDGATYLFAVAMRAGETRATFRFEGMKEGTAVQVIDEARSIASAAGAFSDSYRDWDVHLYRLSP